jgi:glycosyltransferase involved in cell wall biosynthesis
MRLAPLGINLEGYALEGSALEGSALEGSAPRTRERVGPFTVGFFARVAPEKGLHVLCDAYRKLRSDRTLGDARLVVAGYLAPEHEEYLATVTRQMGEAGLVGEFAYRGALDRAEKIAFLHTLDVMSVPATYAEPKGIFLLEAMATGVPVVQPRRGAFPEIIEHTGGGLLVEADNPDALAEGLRTIWRDPARAAALGTAGAQGVRAHYSVGQMADTVEQIYGEIIRRPLS